MTGRPSNNFSMMYRMLTDKEFRKDEISEGREVAEEHRRAVRIEKEEKRQAREAEHKAKEARSNARKHGW